MISAKRKRSYKKGFDIGSSNTLTNGHHAGDVRILFDDFHHIGNDVDPEDIEILSISFTDPKKRRPVQRHVIRLMIRGIMSNCVHVQEPYDVDKFTKGIREGLLSIVTVR